jgi:hypothetical protein
MRVAPFRTELHPNLSISYDLDTILDTLYLLIPLILKQSMNRCIVIFSLLMKHNSEARCLAQGHITKWQIQGSNSGIMVSEPILQATRLFYSSSLC